MMIRKFVLLTAAVFLFFTSNAYAKDYGDYFVTKYGSGGVRSEHVESVNDSLGNLKTLKIRYANITAESLGLSGNLTEEKVGKAFIKEEARVLGIKTFEGITYVGGTYSKKARGTIGWSRYLYAKVKYGSYLMPQWSIRIEMDDNFAIKDITAELLPLTEDLKKAVETADRTKSFNGDDFKNKIFNDLKDKGVLDEAALAGDIAVGVGRFEVISKAPYAIRRLFVVDIRKLSDEDLKKFSFKNPKGQITKPLYFVGVNTNELVIIK